MAKQKELNTKQTILEASQMETEVLRQELGIKQR